MNLTTNYMGLNLRNPIIVGSSSLTNNVKNVKKCVKNGAGAVVLKSLYEEQILADMDNLIDQDEMYLWYPEAYDYVNKISKEDGIQQYLQLIRDCKNEVSVPIIASVNCVSHSEWTKFSKELQAAGADAIELNITIFPDSEDLSCTEIGDEHLKIVKSVSKKVDIPVAAKISAYFSNLRRMAKGMSQAGAKGLVLFNRFYRPDIDIETFKMITDDTFSGPQEITMSLRWVGLLSGSVDCDFAASTGVHNSEGIVKQILAGAKAVQICSALYKNGFSYLNNVLEELDNWMRRKGFENIDEFRGFVNKDPHNSAGWERIHFMKKTMSSIKPIQIE